MALELLSTLASQDGCYGFTFTDSTGAYNVTTNPGGYGAPNPESNEVNGFTISLYAPKSTVAYVFTFTVETGNIVTATVTAPDGTVTDIMSYITDQGLTFPFDTTIGSGIFSIPVTYLGFTDGDMVTDGVWTSVYVITFEDDSTYNTTTYLLSQCATCCCVQKMFVNLSKCGCEGDKVMTAQKADAFLKSATYAANLGMMTQAQEDIDKASEVCTGNCNSCN